MLNCQGKIQAAVFCSLCIFFIFGVKTARSEVDTPYVITSAEANLTADRLQYTISGDTPPIYNIIERFSPFRVVVDIAGAEWGDGVSAASAQIPENSFSSLTIEDLDGQQPRLKRFIFSLSDSHDYLVTETANGIQIIFSPKAGEETELAVADDLAGITVLKDLKIVSTPNSTTISILANGPIEDYSVENIGAKDNKPPRMYIDIKNVGVNQLVRDKQVGTSVAKVRVATRGKGARIVFDSAAKELFTYTVVPSPSGLDVVIDETGFLAKKEQSQNDGKQAVPENDETLDQLITSSEKLLAQDPDEIASKATLEKVAVLEDDFSFSGYKKQRISVDFYKIDIHNVFRLFKDITDLNIIIDEDVKGSLTLALNDVPWDFALDIILNLMDLKKEEKFNTIVIYPAKKEFAWPTRAEDNLAFEADIEVIEEEALIIERSGNFSKEIMKAKELIAMGRLSEKKEAFEDAAVLYTEALNYWPDNTKISNRLASLYLANLGGNAKAVYFAKKTLANDPLDRNAALYAAIGSANMQRLAEANEYFLQSVSDTPPMKEALLSYAAFSENNSENEAALILIDKYHSYYGESVDSMLAKARILDKMGLDEKARQQYYALISSGFQLRPDLKKFIEGRLATKSIN
jgi:type IV pilus assembly protein PilQ